MDGFLPYPVHINRVTVFLEAKQGEGEVWPEWVTFHFINLIPGPVIKIAGFERVSWIVENCLYDQNG